MWSIGDSSTSLCGTGDTEVNRFMPEMGVHILLPGLMCDLVRNWTSLGCTIITFVLSVPWVSDCVWDGSCVTRRSSSMSASCSASCPCVPSQRLLALAPLPSKACCCDLLFRAYWPPCAMQGRGNPCWADIAQSQAGTLSQWFFLF